ncbi:MAG: integrin alpha, partial [Planctomycetota bacterium]
AGQGPFNRFGFSASFAGDVDGDSVQDVLVGAPYFMNESNTMELGLSYAQLLSGASGAVLQTYFSDFGCPTCFTTRFGWSVSGGGDVDGDGIPDSIVGETHASPVRGLAVFSGVGGTVIYETGDWTGSSVQHLGDVDGDGFGDFLGADALPNAISCNQYVTSPSNGYLGCGRGVVFSGSDGGILYTLKRPGSVILGGTSAAARDLDGDDFPDVLLGDWGYPAGAPLHPGRLTAFSLAPVGVTVYGTGCPAGGTGIPRIGIRGVPEIGTTTAVNVSKTVPGGRALLVLGLSDTAWGPVPLPLDLGSLGMAGCSLLASADLLCPIDTEPTPPAPGRGSVLLAIPFEPSLIGAAVFVQWIVGSAPGALIPGGATRALRIQFS